MRIYFMNEMIIIEIENEYCWAQVSSKNQFTAESFLTDNGIS